MRKLSANKECLLIRYSNSRRTTRIVTMETASRQMRPKQISIVLPLTRSRQHLIAHNEMMLKIIPSNHPVIKKQSK